MLICERHHQPPSWWDDLSHSDRRRLLAFNEWRKRQGKK